MSVTGTRSILRSLVAATWVASPLLASCATPHDDADRDAAAAVQPLVMLVVDTSISMELKVGCVCDVACTECEPDCNAAEKNRWAGMLEALTGTFENFSCATPSDDFYTYDRDRHIDYHRPNGAQMDDGVLDTFASRVRFGIATFDGVGPRRDASGGYDEFEPLDEFDFELSRGAEGLWSYPSTGDDLFGRPDGTIRGAYRWPEAVERFFVDTGIRSAHATHGALTVAYEQSTAEALNRDMQDTLLVTRPFVGTPIAAALYDLFWLFTKDPDSEAERARAASQRHVVLITDGRPDNDYRWLDCDCLNDGSCDPPPDDEGPYGCP